MDKSFYISACYRDFLIKYSQAKSYIAGTHLLNGYLDKSYLKRYALKVSVDFY
ncbi:hypothetical protein MTBBW1_350004 [Desulfamplus magnetovallimortis]|uniref:Uncharacterized protein n=1 Tax=Desulfamplus magnetovallimortis TaxID=1246637 RepID=A0A1W1HGG7_9BACT|nr:hypothetical protein MTBBW1_350004 [Desulfamplus magnetovallimortis]